MSAAFESADSVVDAVHSFAPTQVERFLDLCAHFQKWERQEILLGNPSAHTVQKHRRSLADAIRNTRWMLAAASDPEAFSPKTFSRLSTLHRRLTDSWDMFYNKPSNEESAELDALEAAHFSK